MKPHSAKILSVAVPIALSLIVMGLAGTGWYLSHPPKSAPEVSDLAYRTARAFSPGQDFEHAGGNPFFEGARWLGLLVALWAVFSLLYNGLHHSRVLWNARLRRKHLVVIGDGDYASHLAWYAASNGVRTTQLKGDAAVSKTDHLIVLPFERASPHLFQTSAIRHARRLILAPGDDATAIDLALKAERQLTRASIAVRLSDLWLARSLHTLPGAERLRAFTDDQAGAREIVRRHLPFLAADQFGQTKIHSLLIGDHDPLEALMVEIILSACTLTFGRPSFSFVCPDPEGFLARLHDRFPEIEQAADITASKAVISGHGPWEAPDNAITDPASVSGVYVCLSDDAQSLATGLQIRERLLRDEAFQAPIFVRLSQQEGLERPTAGSLLTKGQLIPFGGHSDIARATGVLTVHGEDAEKAWHQAYLKFAPGDAAASLSWDQLSEEYRNSNQRAVAHIYAKLYEAGFDLRAWLAKHDPWIVLPELARGETVCDTPERRDRLARLEHERWIADRRMSGWRGGPQRDNLRKVHDNFVPFDALTPEVQSYDVKFVDLLDRILKHSRTGMRRSVSSDRSAR